MESLPSLVWENILSYATVSDLCALDLTCRTFRQTSDGAWRSIAQGCFGLAGGKKAIQRGVALANPNPERRYVFQVSPLMTQKLYDISTLDYIAGTKSHRTFALGVCDSTWRAPARQCLLVYKKQTMELQSFQCLDRSQRVWQSICAAGYDTELISPVILLHGATVPDFSEFAVQQGTHYYQEYSLRELFPSQAESIGERYLFGVIGSHNHFIIFTDGTLFVLRFRGREKLSDPNSLVPVSSIYFCNKVDDLDQDTRFCIQWGGEELPVGTFVTCGKHRIAVWRLDDSTSEVAMVQSIATVTSYRLASVAISPSYIAVCTANRPETLLCVYDRDTSGARHLSVSYLVDPNLRVNLSIRRTSLYNPGMMRFIGETLAVTTLGDVPGGTNGARGGIFFWQLRIGRRVHFRTPVVANDSGRSAGKSSMIMIRGEEYTCFVTCESNVDEKLTAWGFPESEQGLRNLQKVVRRNTFLSGTAAEHRFCEVIII